MATQDMDFVWAEMLRYWQQTGQLAPTEAASHGELTDESDFRALGWDISYDRPMPIDPQSGPDAPWQLWVPWPAASADGLDHWPSDLVAAHHEFGADPISVWGVAA